MGQDEEARHRQHPAERFTAPEHLLDLRKTAEELRNEPMPARQGHHQITVFHRGLMAVVLFVFEQSGELADHKADGEVTIHLVEGAVEVSTAAHSYDLSPTMMVALAPGVRHSVKAKQASIMLLTVCMKPLPGAESFGEERSG
jgi:quercetin dioxygenase-like cupin family protein